MRSGEIWFVLWRPASPDNVGMVARALANFGPTEDGRWRLVLADLLHPRVWREARKTAVRAEEVLDGARVEPSLEAAVAGAVRVVGTTAREVEGRPAVEPRACAEQLVREAQRGPVALVFGEEKRGLPNALLSRMDALATIPTAPSQPSLNLAQAATVFAYELRRALQGAEPVARRRPTRAPPPAPSPLATRADLERLRALARETLLECGFLNPQQPDRVLDEMCRAFFRGGPSIREVSLYLAALQQLSRR